MSTTFELYILLFLPIVVLAQIVQDKCVYVFYIIEHSIIHFFFKSFALGTPKYTVAAY